ncbi:MAG: hypothetical protein AAF387_09620 [Pseudomonadota bacterium]
MTRLTQPRLLALKYPGVLALIAMLSAGCGINTRDENGQVVNLSKEDFATYVEQTFRHHNGVVNELILASSLSDDPELELPPELIRAEKAMVENCQPLNEMVSATIEGRELSVWAKLRLIDKVPECGVWSRRVENMIQQVF